MFTTTLIATIIHMNCGFTMPEALWRGFVSALMVGALGIALYLIGLVIVGISRTLRNR